MALVNDKAVFEVNVKGEETGKVYEGKFVMKLFLSLRERSKVAVEFSKVNEGNFEDQELAVINKMICEYLVQAEEAPEWFKDGKVFDMVDLSPIIAIKEQLTKCQSEYSDKINK